MDCLNVQGEPKYTYLFQNPDMPLEERISYIVSLMTLNEKVTFGFGLSYTTFVWSNLKTGDGTLAKDGLISVNVDVQNTGKHAGDEVVQLYVKHLTVSGKVHNH